MLSDFPLDPTLNYVDKSPCRSYLIRLSPYYCIEGAYRPAAVKIIRTLFYAFRDVCLKRWQRFIQTSIDLANYWYMYLDMDIWTELMGAHIFHVSSYICLLVHLLLMPFLIIQNIDHLGILNDGIAYTCNTNNSSAKTFLIHERWIL